MQYGSKDIIGRLINLGETKFKIESSPDGVLFFDVEPNPFGCRKSRIAGFKQAVSDSLSLVCRKHIEAGYVQQKPVLMSGDHCDDVMI